MTCAAKNLSGRPCGITTKNKYCHIHKHLLVAETFTTKASAQKQNLGSLNKKVSNQRSTIAELIVDNSNLKDYIDQLTIERDQATAQLNELTIERDTLQDQLDIAEFEKEQLRSDLQDYYTIGEFEALFRKIKEICATGDIRIISSHLKLKFSRTREKIKALFPHDDDPFDAFHKLRIQRNDLAHFRN